MAMLRCFVLLLWISISRCQKSEPLEEVKLYCNSTGNFTDFSTTANKSQADLSRENWPSFCLEQVFDRVTSVPGDYTVVIDGNGEEDMVFITDASGPNSFPYPLRMVAVGSPLIIKNREIGTNLNLNMIADKIHLENIIFRGMTINLRGSSQTVRNCVISDAVGDGLHIRRGNTNILIEDCCMIRNSNGCVISASNVTVRGSRFGIALDGTMAGNAEMGLLISPRTSQVIVGDNGPGGSNFFSNNGKSGILLESTDSLVCNAIAGIGIDGVSPMPNKDSGIKLGTLSASNYISDSVFSGNLDAGIEDKGEGNVFVGNIIGLDVSGTVAVGNHFGADLDSMDCVFGRAGEHRNVVAGNLDQLVIRGQRIQVTNAFLGLSATGLTSFSSHAGIVIGSSTHCNITETHIVGSRIGVDGFRDLFTSISAVKFGIDIEGKICDGCQNEVGISLQHSKHFTMGDVGMDPVVVESSILNGVQLKEVSGFTMVNTHVFHGQQHGVVIDDSADVLIGNLEWNASLNRIEFNEGVGINTNSPIVVQSNNIHENHGVFPAQFDSHDDHHVQVAGTILVKHGPAAMLDVAPRLTGYAADTVTGFIQGEPGAKAILQIYVYTAHFYNFRNEAKYLRKTVELTIPSSGKAQFAEDIVATRDQASAFVTINGSTSTLSMFVRRLRGESLCQVCNCEQDPGTADCDDHGLTELPPNLPKTVSNLHLRHNQLVEADFIRTSSTTLASLDLSNNHLMSLADLRHFPGLRSFKMDTNHLHKIKVGALNGSHTPDLGVLSFRNNHLTTIEIGALDSLALIVLDISNNPIFVQAVALEKLDSLISLSASGHGVTSEENVLRELSSVGTVEWHGDFCPPQYIQTPSAGDILKCSRCPAGSYRQIVWGRISSCTLCIAGTLDHDLDPSTPCVICGPGHYIPGATGGSCSEFACLPGWADTDYSAATPCKKCKPGTFSNKLTCNECPDGTSDHDSDPATPCEKCQEGLFSPILGFGPCQEPLVARSSTDSGKWNGVLIGGVIGGLLLIILVLIAWANYMLRSTKPYDFASERLAIQSTKLLLHGSEPVRPREISRSKVTLAECIGQGASANVWKGSFQNQTIAVKTSRGDKQMLYEETLLLSQLGEHKNIISIIGVVTIGDPVLLLLTYCPNGSLDHFLREHKSGIAEIPLLNKVRMCAEVACGMEYLESISLTHRDLAARNVLLDEDYTCRITDFGLARQDGYYLQTSQLPVRWTAPEVLQRHSFTSRSDSWSFGVFMYECFTAGALPYGTMSNQEVITATLQGKRLEPPENCPDNVYKIMQACWQRKPSNRPDFTTLSRKLDDIVDDCDVLNRSRATPSIFSGTSGTNPNIYAGFQPSSTELPKGAAGSGSNRGRSVSEAEEVKFPPVKATFEEPSLLGAPNGFQNQQYIGVMGLSDDCKVPQDGAYMSLADLAGDGSIPGPHQYLGVSDLPDDEIKGIQPEVMQYMGLQDLTKATLPTITKVDVDIPKRTSREGYTSPSEMATWKTSPIKHQGRSSEAMSRQRRRAASTGYSSQEELAKILEAATAKSPEHTKNHGYSNPSDIARICRAARESEPSKPSGAVQLHDHQGRADVVITLKNDGRQSEV